MLGIRPHRREQAPLALRVPTLEEIRVAQIAQEIRIIRFPFERGLIALLGGRKVTAAIRQNCQLVIGDRVPGLHFEHAAIAGFSLFVVLESSFTMSAVELFVDRGLIDLVATRLRRRRLE